MADGSQQAQLAGPLVDRQRGRVGDAEQGDDDGEYKQGVDDAEEQVDALGQRRGVLVAGDPPLLVIGLLRRRYPLAPTAR